MTINIFEQASRKKLTFSTVQGLLSVDHLWDLPLTSNNPQRTSLDKVAKAAAKEIRKSEEDSFVAPTSSNTTANLQLELVKHIIAVRLEENEKAKTAAENKEQRQKIAQAIARKKDSALEEKSVEELEEELKNL